MSQVFFDEMDIPNPHYNLHINSLSHGAMTGKMLESIEEICLKEKPDYVMVYGDTNSTIAGSLAAKKLAISVIHVEAGLRSFNIKMPEEINRILTDRISDILFCPTKIAINNLKNEGITNSNFTIVENGDVMQDAAIYYSKKSEKKSTLINDFGFNRNNYVLATFHRQENTDSISKLNSIIDSLNYISNELQVIVPIHPRTRKIIQKEKLVTKFNLIDPVGYFDMIELIKNSRLILTDSGGLQKEAYFFNKYCITLREQTEWVELIENHYNYLAGSNKNEILKIYNFLKNKPFVKSHELYGGGNASYIIRETLEKLI
jgi:UDP-GlcNAc3NAcA epimerase